MNLEAIKELANKDVRCYCDAGPCSNCQEFQDAIANVWPKLIAVAEAAAVMVGDGVTYDEMYQVESRFCQGVREALAALEAE